jgi:hypothetical protein
LKPVVARPSVRKGHNLAKYGVGQFGCAVRDVVISVRCEKLPFGIVKLETGGGGKTKVGHVELISSSQDVVEVSIEVHYALSAHRCGRPEQLIQNQLDRTGHFRSAGR